MWPPAKARKSVSALPPQMGIVLIGPGFSSVACTLISYGLVVGKHPHDALVRPLMHTSRLYRHSTACPPLEPSAQLLDTARRAVPPVAHGGLIGDACTVAAGEKPDVVVIGNPSIEHARRAMAFAAQENEVLAPEMRLTPVADNVLPYGVQPLAAGGPARKCQNQAQCIRPAVDLISDGSE